MFFFWYGKPGSSWQVIANIRVRFHSHADNSLPGRVTMNSTGCQVPQPDPFFEGSIPWNLATAMRWTYWNLWDLHKTSMFTMGNSHLLPICSLVSTSHHPMSLKTAKLLPAHPPGTAPWQRLKKGVCSYFMCWKKQFFPRRYERYENPCFSCKMIFIHGWFWLSKAMELNGYMYGRVIYKIRRLHASILYISIYQDMMSDSIKMPSPY